MATIRIKRTTGSTNPASLANAELAFIEGAARLVYGTGTGGAGGSATSIIDVGGSGAFCALTGTQTVAGAKTFTGGVTFSTTACTFSAAVALGSSATATTPATGDSSTTVATTAFVKNQNYLTANQSITVSGDVTGSGTTAITATIASGVVTNAKLASVATSTIKGRASAGTGAPEDLTGAQVKTILAIVPGDISGFDTQVRTNPLNVHATATGSYNMGGFLLTNVGTPSAATDVANKQYVDNAQLGLEFKASVRVASTANVPITTGLVAGQTIDGVTLVAGDRVLLKNQTVGSENGIYVAVASGSGTRATDFNSATTVLTGSFMYVDSGTTNGGSAYVLSTTGSITVGTTSLTFTQFSGGGSVPGNYAGQTSIVTVGTLTTGTWNASTIGVAYGGTGATTLTGLVKGNGTSAFTAATASTDGTTGDYLAPSSVIDGGTF